MSSHSGAQRLRARLGECERFRRLISSAQSDVELAFAGLLRKVFVKLGISSRRQLRTVSWAS
jgi:hypothetical protein